MKILIIRFSSIGDIVLTTPVIRCLRKKFPKAKIHFLTKATFQPLLAANPHLDKIHVLEDNFPELVAELKAEKYDLIIDLHKNIRTFRIKQTLKTETISFKKLNFQKWLKVNFKLDYLPPMHIVDRYFEALKPLGVVDDGNGLDYYIWEKEIYESTLQISQIPFVALVLGAKHNTKKLPREQIIKLCEKLNSKILLLGGKEDTELGEELNEAFPAKVINMCGKTSINEAAYLIKHAKKVITHDTGLMHIAAAFKKPIISIWGNTVPDFGMYPYFGFRHDTLAKQNVHFIQVEELACRPCSKIGYPKCPKGHFRCMTELDMSEIATIANA